MNLLFAAFLAALTQDAHASKPRVRMPKSAKGGALTCDDSPSSPGRRRPYPFSSVYTMTNQPGNEVLVYSRDMDTGELTFENAFPTGGDGETFQTVAAPGLDPVLSTDSVQVVGECVLACNAGSHEITSFHIHNEAVITFADRASTDGTFPISISEAIDGVIYVLNAGGQGSVQPFRLNPTTCGLSPVGRAVPMEQGGGPLDPENPAPDNPPFAFASPNQVGLTPAGDVIATVAITGGQQNFPAGSGSIHFFKRNDDGSLEYPNKMILPLHPFAFDHDSSGRLQLAVFTDFVNFGGALQVWEYGDAVGEITLVDTAVIEPVQAGTCWVKYNARNGCSYTTNTGLVGSVSTFKSTEEGVDLLDALAGTNPPTFVGPIDEVISDDGNNVYALTTGASLGPNGPNDGAPRIHVFSTDCDCGMSVVQTISDGLPLQQDSIDNDGVFNGVIGLATFPAPYPMFP